MQLHIPCTSRHSYLAVFRPRQIRVQVLKKGGEEGEEEFSLIVPASQPASQPAAGRPQVIYKVKLCTNV